MCTYLLTQILTWGSALLTPKNFVRPKAQAVKHISMARYVSKNIIDLPGGQINDPLVGEILLVPPEPPSNPSPTLEGLFLVTLHPFRALAPYLAS